MCIYIFFKSTLYSYVQATKRSIVWEYHWKMIGGAIYRQCKQPNSKEGRNDKAPRLCFYKGPVMFLAICIL